MKWKVALLLYKRYTGMTQKSQEIPNLSNQTLDRTLSFHFTDTFLNTNQLFKS